MSQVPCRCCHQHDSPTARADSEQRASPSSQLSRHGEHRNGARPGAVQMLPPGLRRPTYEHVHTAIDRPGTPRGSGHLRQGFHPVADGFDNRPDWVASDPHQAMGSRPAEHTTSTRDTTQGCPNPMLPPDRKPPSASGPLRRRERVSMLHPAQNVTESTSAISRLHSDGAGPSLAGWTGSPRPTPPESVPRKRPFCSVTSQCISRCCHQPTRWTPIRCRNTRYRRVWPVASEIAPQHIRLPLRP